MGVSGLSLCLIFLAAVFAFIIESLHEGPISIARTLSWNLVIAREERGRGQTSFNAL